jgi:O-antigen/teichoic acid export membrane protein
MGISTRASVGLSVAGSYVGLSLQFVSTMILARLLTPAEIGVYGAGFSIIALAHLFRDFGLNQYLIQEKNLDQNKLSATFSLSLIMAWSLGSAIFLLSGFVANFFNEPDVEMLLKLLSINFFAIPFGSVTMALLRKNLKFHICSAIGLTAGLLGIAVTLWSAYQGARYFSMAYGAIAETMSVVLLSNFFRPKDLRLYPKLKGTKEIFHFGSMVGVGNIIQQFTTSANDAMIAKYLGLGSLGYFSRAHGTYALFDRIFLSSIRPIVLPLFAASNRDTEQLAAAYYRAVSYSVVLAWPFFLFMAIYTTELIHVLYGDQWDRSIPLIRILSIGAMMLPPVFFTDNLFIACGKPQITLRIIVASGIVKLGLIIPACFISLEAVSMAFVTFFFVKVALSLYYLGHVLSISIRPLLPVFLKNIPILACTLIPPLLMDTFISQTLSETSQLMILMACAFTGWTTALILTRHDFYTELMHFIPFGKTS